VLLRFSLYLIGVAVMIGSLVGAKLLTGGHDENVKAESPGANGKISGPLVLGTVDSNPQPIPYGLPPVLPSGTIAEVFVKDGDEVHADQKLYEFDTSIQQCDLKRAKINAEMASSKVATAKEAEKQHAKKVALLEEAVKIAETKKQINKDKYSITQHNLETGYSTAGFPMETWPDRLKNDVRLFEANGDYITSSSELELKKGELAQLKTSDISLLVKEAQVAVDQAQAEVTKAQTAVDLCTVQAKTPGTIEQVTISRGATLGISTVKPALWLIPAGPRVVRAEIEAEFAHRVSSSLEGKEVTIYDNSDPKLTYKGKVRRVGEAFLPKRSSEGLLGSDTLVLPALIEVIDAKPANRPPLRIGQRVRVDLGQ
jgi:multidrug resistance efflux pump